MNWYYVSAGQQAGPVDDAKLEELVLSGQVTPDTLVWHEGMSNWLPYGQVSAEPGAAPPVQPAFGTASSAGLASGGNDVVCAECGKVFPKENTIQYGNARVCANCKPIFMQKLAEGATRFSAAGPLNYAGFWIRFGAIFIDRLLLFAVNVVLSLVSGLGMGASFRGTAPADLSSAQMGLRLTIMVIMMVIVAAYEILMVGKYGATLGKMACKIRVVRPDGSPVGFGVATGRYFAKILSAMICLIGYIMAGFDEEKRALHDRICDTRVIMSN